MQINCKVCLFSLVISSFSSLMPGFMLCSQCFLLSWGLAFFDVSLELYFICYPTPFLLQGSHLFQLFLNELNAMTMFAILQNLLPFF